MNHDQFCHSVPPILCLGEVKPADPNFSATGIEPRGEDNNYETTDSSSPPLGTCHVQFLTKLVEG